MGASNPWGRVADDGTVYVRTADGERVVGSWQAGSPEEGLSHFVRRYDDLATEVRLLEARLASGIASGGATAASASRLRAGLSTAQAVGDLESLDKRLTALIEQADSKRAEERERRAAAARQAAGAKEALAAEAESLASSTQWKATGDRFRQLVEEWRQIKGVDRKLDAQLWKRVSTARAEFTRRRGAYFSSLGDQRKEVTARKEKLIAEAEALSASTEWAAAASRYRSLLDEWKAAGRTTKDVDDALWKRFRAARDTFYSRRSETFTERDAALRGNQERKEAILAEAESLDPASDLPAAQARLRQLQEKWDAAGKVPREALPRLERRMSAAAAKVRDTADEHRRAASAASSPLAVRLRESVTKLERKIERARAAGDTETAEELAEQLATQRSWLDRAQPPEETAAD